MATLNMATAQTMKQAIPTRYDGIKSGMKKRKIQTEPDRQPLIAQAMVHRRKGGY